MIRHIVMFKLKKDVDIAEAWQRAKKLADVVPSVEKMEVVCNSPLADASNYELALICDFMNMEDLNAYQNHPEHLKFGAYISQIRESRACIDFEIIP